MVLNAIPSYLLSVTPVVDFAEMIRWVPAAVLLLVKEGEVTAQ
jgi:hypothetical protein